MGSGGGGGGGGGRGKNNKIIWFYQLMIYIVHCKLAT